MPSQDFEVLTNDALSDTFVNTQKNVNFLKQTKGKRVYFPSNAPETYIVNAMTGVKYTWKVGTFESQRLYSVVDTTSACDNKGFVIKQTDKDTETGNTNYLYYDSPQQYMQHRKVSLEPETILSWRNRVSTLFPSTETTDGEFNAEAYHKLAYEHNELLISNFKNRQDFDLQNETNRSHKVEHEKPMYVDKMYLNNQEDTWHLVSKKKGFKRSN